MTAFQNLQRISAVPGISLILREKLVNNLKIVCNITLTALYSRKVVSGPESQFFKCLTYLSFYLSEFTPPYTTLNTFTVVYFSQSVGS